MKGETYGLPAAIFALKVFLAAMLALYVALRIGLPRPYWAVLTSFIVAQPTAGAVLSKGVFRVIGTAIGAAATVIMVPTLSPAPELLVPAISLWVALCIFISLLDRTPRSYMFVLAGYSACLIGLPSVETPGAIFDIAVLRVQEITIGILAGSLVHGVLWPGSVTDMLMRRVEGTLTDAERWSRDSMAQERVPDLDKERRRLALDITEMHQMAVHLPFDTAKAAPRQRTVRALQNQLSMILPLAAAVDDRIRTLMAETGAALSEDIGVLLADCREWLDEANHDAAERHERAEALIRRAAELEPEVYPGMGWDAALRLSLLARIASLIAAHRDCRDLRDQMLAPTARPVTARVAQLLESTGQRQMHRDYAGALRTGFGAALTITVGCVLWIASGWDQGSTAVMLAGVFLSLFSAADDPTRPLRFFFFGTLIATAVGLLYGFAILPQVDGFAMMAAVMAPALLLGGAFMASPRWGMVALPSMLGLASPSLLAEQYSSDFAGYLNGAIAQLAAVFFALTMVRLLQSAGLDGTINRTLRAGWTDIARRAKLDRAPDVPGWISLMLDRTGLLAPRLAARGDDPGQPLYDALRDLRTGIVIGELRQLRFDLGREEGRVISPVLEDVSRYYTRLGADKPPEIEPGTLRHVDTAIASLANNPSTEVRRTGVLALISLRRNLFPDAPDYISLPERSAA
ncbi:FUSC family protein [Croceicoccus mobilis]|uniref:Fusaric acid resistance protein n=1 Tax=Croceicoccus mobilis TaxID=1703339 RepID=A0A916Z686_9SPHN|nr:FUSC family protein [Croceicoccus mobilis]GGD78640.1 hypothetical protein GCM10010990_30640 [Croceicoccus mobilis]